MEFSQRYPFSQWPDGGVPAVSAGVYAIWRGDELVYCGMSGRGIEAGHISSKKKYGLITRLASHATGRLSGDQFCVYVANRFVVPDLTASDLHRFATGEVSLDRLTKAYIRQYLDYQYVIVESSAAAFELEKRARRGEVFGVTPLLNPL